LGRVDSTARSSKAAAVACSAQSLAGNLVGAVKDIWTSRKSLELSAEFSVITYKHDKIQVFGLDLVVGDLWRAESHSAHFFANQPREVVGLTLKKNLGNLQH